MNTVMMYVHIGKNTSNQQILLMKKWLILA